MQRELQARGTAKRRSREKGVILLLTVLFLLFIALPMMGLAIDVGVGFAAKARLQTAVDGAALAGARSLSRGRSLAEQQGSAEATARAFFAANMHGAWNPMNNLRVSVSWPPAPPKTAVMRVDGHAEAPTYFLKLFGYEHLSLNAVGVANRRDVNIAIVLDRSGSIENLRACDDLRAAANDFVNTFVDGRDRVALITYGTTYKVDFPAVYTFKSSSPSITDKINNVRCVGGTNSAAAYWKAWQELERIGERNTLNVILFFTDGQPNTLHLGNLQIKSNSGCTNKSARAGVIAPAGTAVWGILQPSDPYPAPSPGEDWVAITNNSGCAFRSNLARVAEDVVALAPSGTENEVDFFGNALIGYKTPISRTNGRIRIDSSTTVTNAATNALNNAAQRVRQISTSTGLDVYTYAVALGGSPAPAEHELMNRVANTPVSPSYDSNKPTGMYLLADNADQLSQAFSQIASDILRISQ